MLELGFKSLGPETKVNILWYESFKTPCALSRAT